MDLFEKIVNNSNSSLLDFVSFQTTNIYIYMLDVLFIDEIRLIRGV